MDNSMKAMAPDITDSLNSNNDTDVLLKDYNLNEKLLENTSHQLSENMNEFHKTHQYENIMANREKPLNIIAKMDMFRDIDGVTNNSVQSVDPLKRKRRIDSLVEDSTESKKFNNAVCDEKKINLRKNIRDVMDEAQLDTDTLAAQREESERLARVAEQQKIIREYQRQNAVNRQFVRTQNKVLSLLKSGNTYAKPTEISEGKQMNDLLSEECQSVINKDTCSTSISTSSNEDTVSEIKSDVLDCDSKPDIELYPPTSSTTSVTTEQVTSDIVTIEDSSSEDDCIMLSDDEEEDFEDEPEDDPNNSGLHVKDAYNVPDEHGRVVVNVGHPEGEEDIFIAPQIAKTIKPHQIGGVRFLFDNIIESTKRFRHSSGFGCILAHSMGLGKTLQIVCFCDIFLRHTSSKTVLCVMPINTLQNWVSEFNMWAPKQSIDHESIRPREFDVYVLNDQHKTLSARAKVVLKWSEQGGVLLIGYELFRLLALKLMPTRRRRGKNANLQNSITEANARLMETIHSALVKPGPDLVICDEGHRIKNAHAGISLALKQIRTRRRIVLTGYPLQNNLLEYWCMVDFVRPNYLGTRTEFCNMFERPIQNGQCIDSTPEDIKLMRYRAHVLHSLLVGFVQRRSHMVLQQTLPQKLEYVILTRMTTFQRQLYQTFMNDVVRSKAVPNPLKAFAVCCKIWNHPDVLYNFLKKRETDLDLEIDDNEVVNETVQKITPTPNITEEKKDKIEKIQPPPLIKNETDKSTENIPPVSTVINEDDSSCTSAKKNSEIACSNQSFNGMYYPTNYYHQTVESTYSTETEVNNYWQEPNVPYFFYNSLPSSLSFPVKPDYVGQMDKNLAEKSTNDTENITNSSEIVDLDTQEIKTVETDIDMNQKLIIKSNACDDTKKDVNISLDKSISNIKDSNTTDETKSLTDTKIERVSPTGAIEKEHSQKSKSDDGIPYEWAIELMKKYEPGLISNSPKMEIFFCILNESIQIGDRVLLFSQSLLTLNLIEIFLNSNIVPGYNTHWTRNVSYFRLDGSTTSQEREKLVNEFNSNYNVKLFLISTRAGSLGINLVGANRVIVFDASWNPCHDTQAVYRIYRYGQKKSCYVYRIVMDKCLEKKIYDRQIKKQGMSDRVVDECNPDAHLSMKDVTNLCHDYDDDIEDDNKNTPSQFVQPIESFEDIIIQKIIEQYKSCLSKEPFHHESLLIDRKEKKLSQAEKRQAHRGYELEKKAASRQSSINTINKIQYRIVRNDGTVVNRPVASIRPMQTITKTQNSAKSGSIRSTRWIPAEVWQRQGMTAQEMTLPLDVVIPTNSNDKSNIVLRAGQRVMVLKSAKGIYMQLDSGKIIAIRTSNKATEESKVDKGEVIDITSEGDNLADDKTNSIKNANKTTAAGENLGLKMKDKDPVDNMKEDQNKAQITNEVCSINKTKEIQKKNVFVQNNTTNNQIEKEKQSNNSKMFKSNVNKDSLMETKNESLSINNKDGSHMTFSPKSYDKSVSGSITKNKTFTMQTELQENTVINNSMPIESSESKNINYEKGFRKQFYKSAPSNMNNSNSLFASRSINIETFKRDERMNKPSTFQPLPAEKQMSQPTNLFRGKNQNHGPFNAKNNDAVSNYFIQHPKGKQFVAPNKSSYASSQKGDNRSMPEIIQNPFSINCETTNESKPQTVSTNSSSDYLPVKNQTMKMDQSSRTEIAPVSQQPFPQHQQQSHSKFHLHVPHYDLQHTQFSNSIAPLHLGVPQCINPESNLASNAFFSSRDVNNYSSHYDTIYNSNNMGASCDYSPQYPEYSYAAYNHPQYHSQLHTNTYGGAASTAIATNPYNLHWSPLVTSTPLNEQYNTMYSSAYTQNGAPSNQWCNP